MKKLSDWIIKISTGWVTLICLVIFLLFTAFVLPSQAEGADAYGGEVGSPDTSLYYSADELYQFAEFYGPQGRSAYIRARVTFDVVWPIVYLAFLATAISWVYQKVDKQGKYWRWLNLLPVFGLVLDYLENGATSIVMARFPDRILMLPHLAGIFTALKWVFIGGSFVVLVIGLGMAGWRWVQSKI
jgi:hypothetical protein